MGHVDICVTQNVPHNLRPCAFAQHMARMHVRKLRKYLLLVESAESESLQKLFPNIRGQIGFRVCRCDIRNRLVYSFVYGGCQKGVGLTHLRPAEYRRHSHDLSALVDLVSHGWVQVGTCRKQRVKAGHHAVLPDEGIRPVEGGVQGASYHLALVVDAAGYGGKISRQSLEVCECAVPPKRGVEGCAVSAGDFPNNLALVVNAESETTSSEVSKGQGSAVFFPQYGVKRCGAGSRVAYGLTLIVDGVRFPIWIATHRRKSSAFAVTQLSLPNILCAHGGCHSPNQTGSSNSWTCSSLVNEIRAGTRVQRSTVRRQISRVRAEATRSTLDLEIWAL
jgi:hypothetical protein